MNLSCIFSRKSPLNFPIATSRARPPTFKLAADFAQRLPEFKFLAAGFPFTGFFTFPIYEYYGRFKGFRSGHFKIRLALSLIFPAGDCSVDGGRKGLYPAYVPSGCAGDWDWICNNVQILYPAAFISARQPAQTSRSRAVFTA